MKIELFGLRIQGTKEDSGNCPTKVIQDVSNNGNKSVLANEKETRTFQSTHANISIILMKEIITSDLNGKRIVHIISHSISG